MAGPSDRPTAPAASRLMPPRRTARSAPAGSLRQRLDALNADQTAPARSGMRKARRGDDPTIRSLSEWIEEINRQPAVYDTGIRMTAPAVWPPAPGGGPRDGIAPWKLARRRELASKYGPLIAVAALAGLYFGYDAVLRHNGPAVPQDATAAVEAPRAPPLVDAGTPQREKAKPRPPFRVTLGDLAPGVPAPVSITATGAAIGGDTMFVFEGLPPGARLSAGAAADGKWAVAPRELAGLTLTPPEGFSGALGFDLSLVRDGATIVHRESYSLPVAAMQTRTPAPQAALSPAPEAAAPPPPPPRVIPGEQKLLERGKAMLDAADISGARLVFQHLAFQGSAAGALALARSYDAAVLARLRTLGVEADAEKARHWYARAAEYGSPEARAWLRRNAPLR